MQLFETLSTAGHEQVVFCHDSESGLRAIIAIHNTVLGPALGGLRMWPYENDEAALTDVLRLSRGMTYKSAVTGLNLGGGKSVIIGDPRKDKSEALLRAFGRAVESLNGRYLTAEDVGMNVSDMEYIRMETAHVTGIPESMGGSGDPSPFTALGTLQGIKACLQVKYQDEDISKYSFAIQGVGHVGFNLARLIREAGGKVFVSDIHQDNVDVCVDELGCEAVEVNEIYDVDATVFAPSALGAVVNENTLDRFRFPIICGSANNVLKTEADGHELEKKGILYGPDYAVNAGGLINVSLEYEGYNRERAQEKVMGIYDNILAIFRLAKEENITSFEAADRLAEKRLASMASVKRTYLPGRVRKLPAQKPAQV